MISSRAAPNLVHIQYIHRLRDLLNEFLDMVLPEENRNIAITFLAQPFGNHVASTKEMALQTSLTLLRNQFAWYRKQAADCASLRGDDRCRNPVSLHDNASSYDIM